ncbi:MAG: Lrp/AsnC family transcriptional regulator [Phycicoccus sp.]|nr:Lrp/AsnC family transcriptional regulator [Phycicoccus sp.]
MPQIPPPRRRLTPGPPPITPPGLDEIDLQLLAVLQADGRRSLAALAREVGIAESTCAGRVRALSERGIVQGYHAQLDAARLGRGVEAMVALRMSGHDRDTVEAFRDEVSQVPGVLAVYNTSGATDYLVHVATSGSDALRTFVLDHLSSRPGVVHAETTLIFESTRGRGIL